MSPLACSSRYSGILMLFWPARAPKRDPHPDPRVETELRRVEFMQSAAEDREARIRRLRKRARKLERHMPKGSFRAQDRQISLRQVREDLAATEAEAAQLHAGIRAAVEGLGEDVLWLNPSLAPRSLPGA